MPAPGRRRWPPRPPRRSAHRSGRGSRRRALRDASCAQLVDEGLVDLPSGKLSHSTRSGALADRGAAHRRRPTRRGCAHPRGRGRRRRHRGIRLGRADITGITHAASVGAARQWSGPGSETGLRGAHEDAAALVAADDLVLGRRLDPTELERVDVELAAPAASLAQGRRTGDARRADLVVEGHEVLPDELDGLRARRHDVRRVAVELARRSSRADSRARGARSARRDPLELGHVVWMASARSMTSSRLLEVALAAAEGLELVLDGGEVLGRADPESRRCWSRVARSRTCCTSASALDSSRCTSPSSVRERTSWSSSRRALPSRSAISACCGRVRRAWSICDRRVSMAWRSSSLDWRAGSAFTAYLRGSPRRS